MKTNYHSNLLPGGTYHFYNKAITGRKMFYEEDDYERFIVKFKKYFDHYIDVLAYCLIPNHFHFLFQVKQFDETMVNSLNNENTGAAKKVLSEESPLNEFFSDQLRRFLSSHSLFINKKYNWSGPLLLKKAKKVEVSHENKLYYTLCYIHHNPIHHGLSKSYETWPYSSFNEYVGENNVVNTNIILQDLGNNYIKVGGDIFVELHKNFKINFEEWLIDH